MLSFQASTQYGDWKGTAEADEHGTLTKDLQEIFRATGKVDDEKEILIAFEFYSEDDFFFLRGYYHLKSQNRDLGGWVPTLNADFAQQQGPIQVKSVKVEISKDEFFRYLKRFSVVFVQRGLAITGRDYEITEEL